MNINPQQEPNTPAIEEAAASSELAYLEQALWKQLAQASTSKAFARAWLTLQCALIEDVSRGLLMLGSAAERLTRAQWPETANEEPQALVATAELAMEKRRGLVRQPKPGETGADTDDCFVAYPFIVEDKLYGVVALQISARPPAQLRTVMRQLQWGSAWLEVQQRRSAPLVASAPRQRLITVVQQVATSLEHVQFQEAATAAVTEISIELNCERVCVGFMHKRHVQVEAFSHSAQFDKKSNLVRAIANAMDEALDQADSILYVPDGSQSAASYMAHAALSASHHNHHICTVPFAEDGELLGAMTFERHAQAPFSSDDVQLCQHLASVIGPILALKRQNDRWIGAKVLGSARLQWQTLTGPGHPGRKFIGGLVVLLLLFLSFAESEYRVSAEASLEGAVQRVIAASMDGYIGDARARAGDIVAEGDLLVSLDDSDLRLEQTKWRSQKSQLERQRRDSLAQHDRAQSRILKAQWEQASAELQLLDKQLAKTQLRAPFDGIIVSGDLSQSLGAPVERGQVLMEVAPLEQYRVVLAVDEREISYLREGQAGELVLPSLPGQSFAFVVEKITPVSTAAEGKNTFRVEGTLLATTESLRPGMEGAGKVAVGEHRLIWIWTHSFTEWLRVWVWSWWY